MSVSEAEFHKMLRDVQKLVSPEVLEEMRLGAGVRRSDNYMPSKTAVRSKRWRDKNRDMGNPYGVRVGQRWLRVGKAGTDYPVVRVLEVGSTHALVSSGLRTTRVRLDRFRPEYQGYERVRSGLVRAVDASEPHGGESHTPARVRAA